MTSSKVRREARPHLLAAAAGRSALTKAAAGSAGALLASSAGEALANGVSAHTLRVEEVLWDVAPGKPVAGIRIRPGWGPPDSARTHNSGEGGRAPPNNGGELSERSIPPCTSTACFRCRMTMDGVPDVSQPPIPPGGSFTHIFQAPPPGTYEYHSHVDVFEQLGRGLYGLLVVEDRRSLVGKVCSSPLGSAGA